MIIREIKITDWRAIESFQRELQPGLNLLKGPNEAGKSSIVEAVSWALHRDLVGGARLKDDIGKIIPAGNPKAKPEVELRLEFPSCAATIRKTLSEDSAARECVLTVRREGIADECFDQESAQNQLKILMASDGETQNANAAVGLEGELLVSAQGAGTVFVGRELSGAARAAANSVALGEGGVLAATSRLEKVRSGLEKRRARELFERLKTNAVDAAKKQSDAARVRDELLELRASHAKYSAIEMQIASLRANIETLKKQVADSEPRAQSAARELETFRERHTTQIKADSEVAELRRAHDESLQKRDALQRRVEEIVRWNRELSRAQSSLKNAQQEFENAQSSLVELQADHDAKLKTHHAAESQTEAVQKQAEAWAQAHDVCVAHRERGNARKRLAQLETAWADLETQKSSVGKVEKTAQRPQINLWRRQYSELENARQMTHHSIEVALRLQRRTSVEWQSDGGAMEQGEAQADEAFIIGGAQTISVILPGVGCIEIAGEGEEARKQSAELDGKKRALEHQLKPFDISWENLPEAFDELEARNAKEENANQQLLAAHNQWQSTLNAGEGLEESREIAREWEDQYKAARDKFDPFREMLPEITREAQTQRERELLSLRERERWQEKESELRAQNNKSQRLYNAAFALLTQAKNSAANAQTRIQNAEEIRQKSSRNLESSQREDETEPMRAELLDDLNTSLYEAKIARDAAIKNRESLGAAVTDETLAHTKHEAEYSQLELQRLQTDLGERRVELRGHCEQDPQKELNDLAFEIETREAEIMRHEARLRGIAVLDAALEAERHRLGRELSTPLNKFLSPWLSEMRGRETHLEFDENGGRITGIRTTSMDAGENGSTHVLPFGSHSGGLQEQTALVLRLILARLAAQKLPSQRLPILLDDPLTQTDTIRREGLWRVLREASEHLQILFVTCHESQLPSGQAHHIIIGDWREKAVEETEVIKPKRTVKKPETEKIESPPKTATEVLPLF